MINLVIFKNVSLILIIHDQKSLISAVKSYKTINAAINDPLNKYEKNLNNAITNLNALLKTQKYEIHFRMKGNLEVKSLKYFLIFDIYFNVFC